MKKNILKFIIICVFAACIGLLLYKKTYLGRQIIDARIEEITNNKTLSGHTEETGTIIDTGTPIDPLQMQSGALDSLLQKRLEYYRESKNELRVGN